MSMTTTLLFGLPIRLPKGRCRLVSSDKARLRENARNQTTRLTNIERVFNAIADGHTTIIAIEDATELAQCTVKKALHELEDWPAGPRITRTITGKAHRHTFQINP